MDRNEIKTPLQLYDSLEQLFRDGCSFNQMELQNEMEKAEQEAASSPHSSPEGFQELQRKLERRGIKPRVMADFSKEEQRLFRRGNFWELRGRLEPEEEVPFQESRKEGKAQSQRKILSIVQLTGMAAACCGVAVAVFLLKPGMEVTGRRDYQFHSEIRNEAKGDIVWNNQEDYLTDLSPLEKAYQEIKDKLGITVLKLNYLPGDIELSKVSIEDRHARLEFVREDSFLYVLEVMYPVEDSANRFSDRADYKKLYNEWMGKWIFMQKNQLEDGLVEYSAYFEHEDAYYYLQGMIEEDKFIHILEDLTLEDS